MELDDGRIGTGKPPVFLMVITMGLNGFDFPKKTNLKNTLTMVYTASIFPKKTNLKNTLIWDVRDVL